jgi:hypothetical protein
MLKLLAIMLVGRLIRLVLSWIGLGNAGAWAAGLIHIPYLLVRYGRGPNFPGQRRQSMVCRGNQQ